MFTLFQCTTGPTICPPSLGCPANAQTLGPTAWQTCVQTIGCPTSTQHCIGGKTTTLDCNNQGAQAQTIPTLPPILCFVPTINCGHPGAQAQTIKTVFGCGIPTNGCINTVSIQCGVTAIAGCNAAQAQTIGATVPPACLGPTGQQGCGNAVTTTVQPTFVCPQTVVTIPPACMTVGACPVPTTYTQVACSTLHGCINTVVPPTTGECAAGAQAQTINFPTNGCIKTISVQCATTAVPTNGCIPTVSVQCATKVLNCGGAQAQTIGVIPTVNCHTVAHCIETALAVCNDGAQAQTIGATVPPACFGPTAYLHCPTSLLGCTTVTSPNQGGAQAQTINFPTNGCIKTISVQCATTAVPTNGCIPTVSVQCATKLLNCGGAQAQTIGHLPTVNCRTVSHCIETALAVCNDGAQAQTIGATVPPACFGPTAYLHCPTSLLGCTTVTSPNQGGAQAQTINFPTNGCIKTISVQCAVTAIAGCGAQAQTVVTALPFCFPTTVTQGGGAAQAQTIGATVPPACFGPTAYLGCVPTAPPACAPHGQGGAQAQTLPIPTMLICPPTLNIVCGITAIAGCK